MLERLHLRWQVVFCVGALQLAALGILGLVLLHNARTAVEDEMAAAEASGDGGWSPSASGNRPAESIGSATR